MQQYELAEQDYIKGMKYKEIAEKYDVTINTVKSWKTRYGWTRGDPSIHRSKEKKCVHTKAEKVCTQKEDAVVGEDGLNDRQRLFAVYFMKSHNATRAYMKAYGCKFETAAVSAHHLLKNPNVKALIDEIRKNHLDRIMLAQEDIIQKYLDIAMADPTEYVDEYGRIREGIEDGSVIAQIIPTKFGTRVVMADKMKALGELNKMFTRQDEDEEDEDAPSGIIMIGDIDENLIQEPTEEEEEDGSHMETAT